jgi:4-azaleucine resistance transporter AzlC
MFSGTDTNPYSPGVLHRMAAGAGAALPIVMGYIPVGFAFGVLAQKAGISPVNTLLFSILVYAGSAQLIAAGLIGAGAGLWTLVATTFIVNLRHMLMSAALSPYFRTWKRWQQAVFAYEITDESFAVHSARFTRGQTDKIETIAVNATAQISWILGTWLGITAGMLIRDVRPYGIDFALPAMFIALLVLQIRNRTQVLAALLAGLMSIGLMQAGLTGWNVIVATVSAAALGVLFERWTKKQSSSPSSG